MLMRLLLIDFHIHFIYGPSKWKSIKHTRTHDESVCMRVCVFELVCVCVWFAVLFALQFNYELWFHAQLKCI